MADAVLGEAFSQLFQTVEGAVSKARMFESLFTRLRSRLPPLSRLVEEMKNLSREVGHPEEEIKSLIDQMKKGTKLVSKCSKISRWNYCMKSHYAGKLYEFDEEIGRFCQVNLHVLSMRNGLQTLAGVKSICKNSLVVNVGMSCAVPRPPKYIVGLDVHMKKLKMQLLKEEVSVLVLTAPGGCGKTTLVKMLCQDEEIKGIFKENIFFVPVSETPNLKVIVDKVFQHKGYQVPEFQTDGDAINQLEQLLNRIEGSILLILDDVWSGSQSLLEEFAFDRPNYKILMTSRTAFSRFTYKLQPLNDNDAMTLFRHSADLQDGSSLNRDKDIKKILKVCGGFPLALKVIGRSLRGKSAEGWRSWLNKWSSGGSILNSESDLLDCLRTSIDFLDDEIIKKCFLDLGLFPEDQRIPVAALIDMWAELYELDEDGIDAIAKLHEITSRNLASLVVARRDPIDHVGKYYSEDFVLQHDLLRELAIHQSSHEPIEQRKRLIMNISGNNLPKWWTEQKQQPIGAHLLSISTDEMFSSSWCDIEPSEVEVLVLNFQSKNYTLPEFVEKMDKLKVLIVTNYGFCHAELGNFQLLESVPYLKKIRLEKVSIPSLCKAPIQLRSLKKISLFMCNIGQAFKNCIIQVSDALPNLMEINMDYCNDLFELPVGLCGIICLKKLSITNCHKLSALPEEIGKLVNLEVLRLMSCTDLPELPESIKSLHNLTILDISDCLSIRNLPKHIGELHNLEELHMKGCLRLRNHLPPSTLDLEQLKLVTCDEERAKLWEHVKEVLTNLHVEVVVKDINLNWLPVHDF